MISHSQIYAQESRGDNFIEHLMQDPQAREKWLEAALHHSEELREKANALYTQFSEMKDDDPNKANVLFEWNQRRKEWKSILEAYDIIRRYHYFDNPDAE